MPQPLYSSPRPSDERAPSTHWIGGFVALGSSLDSVLEQMLSQNISFILFMFSVVLAIGDC